MPDKTPVERLRDSWKEALANGRPESIMAVGNALSGALYEYDKAVKRLESWIMGGE